VRLPLLYGGILTVLMAYRAWIWTHRKPSQQKTAAPSLLTK
jgi:hypothetical protein